MARTESVQPAEAVQLWLVRPEPVRPDELAALDSEERRRAEAFRGSADRMLYLSAHLALRRVLAARLGHVAPQEVRIVRDRNGRPTLPGDRPPFHFSLSHSAGLALLGTAPVRIGVDVQRTLSRTTADLCGRRLHPAEQEELASVQPSARAAHFTRLWTRKEAYLKGLGVGLSRSLAADYLGVDRPDTPAGWTVLDVPCGETTWPRPPFRAGPPFLSPCAGC
uniref:Putative phosphopantheine-transferase SimA11 n=1 Tax=Streptomyces antibioticus TaxID=1890 RepID=Q9AMI5_STRAT|nr:putative phosphopantheine-transferase SimA11 [Streptomyces antibioticus]